MTFNVKEMKDFGLEMEFGDIENDVQRQYYLEELERTLSLLNQIKVQLNAITAMNEFKKQQEILNKFEDQPNSEEYEKAEEEIGKICKESEANQLIIRWNNEFEKIEHLRKKLMQYREQ